jgi:hypothetical protein
MRSRGCRIGIGMVVGLTLVQLLECTPVAATIGTMPALQVSFSPTTITTGATSELTVQLVNWDSDAASEVGFTTTLPDGLSADETSAPACSGTFRVLGHTVSLSAATIAARKTCTVSLTVRGDKAGSWRPMVRPSAGTNHNGVLRGATLVVVDPPAVTMTFQPDSLAQIGPTTLSFAVVNPADNTVPLSGIEIAVALPDGLTATPTTASVCGGTLTVTAQGFSLSGGKLEKTQSCQFSVDVTATKPGDYNPTATVTSDSGPGKVAAAVLSIAAPTPAPTASPTASAVPAQPEPASNGGGSLPFLAIGGVVLVAIVAGGGLWFFRLRTRATPAA